MSRNAAIGLLLAVVAALVYVPTLGFEFVDYDDDVYVVDNEHVRQGWTPDGFRWALATGHASNWHPLTWISHMSDVELFGLNPRGHHATNVILHALNVSLLFGLLVSATGRRDVSLVAAALFALHPINVETVAWIAQRKSLLSTALGLGSALAYVAYTRRGGLGRYLLCGALLALGLMAKPMLVSFPLLFLLLDYWPLERVRTQPVARLVAEKLPLLALCAASSLATILAQRGGGAVGSMELLGPGPRLANAVLAYSRYLRKLVWPRDLAIAYQHPYMEGGSPPELWQILLAATLLAVLTAAALLLPRQRWVAVGWFWFLLALVPVIGLIQVGNQAMADRYAYVPFIGLFALVAGSAVRLPPDRAGKRGPRRTAWVAAVVIVLGLAAAGTWRQQRYWRNSMALFTRGLAVSPRSPTLQFNLATVLEAGDRPEDAIRHYRQALAAAPDAPRVHFGLANALHASGQTNEAVREYETSLELDPDQAEAWFNLANTLGSMGRRADAIAGYRRALEIDPGYAAAYNNLGNALLAAGTLAEALVEFERGATADPELADLQHNLGVALVRSGRWIEALPRFRNAAALAPAWPDPLISASWILAAGPSASLRDPAEAIALARRAAELGAGKSPQALDALGLALAADGRFDDAVAAAETARDLASRAGHDTLAREIQGRLALYRRRIPPVPGE